MGDGSREQGIMCIASAIGLYSTYNYMWVFRANLVIRARQRVSNA